MAWNNGYETRKFIKEWKKRERKPSAVIQKVLNISDKMVAPQSNTTTDDVIFEMWEVLNSMKFRWNLSIEEYASLFQDAECRQKLLSLIQDGIDYLNTIKGGYITNESE